MCIGAMGRQTCEIVGSVKCGSTPLLTPCRDRALHYGGSNFLNTTSVWMQYAACYGVGSRAYVKPGLSFGKLEVGTWRHKAPYFTLSSTQEQP